MKKLTTWKCEDCEDTFYTDSSSEPEFCPYCRSTDLEEN